MKLEKKIITELKKIRKQLENYNISTGTNYAYYELNNLIEYLEGLNKA